MRKLSYISGTSNKPLIGQTIGVFFDHIVEKYPDNLAVISRHQNIRWTYEKLQIEVNRCAKGFRAINIEKGDRVGIWANNCVEWLIVQIASAKLGAILVNINPGYRTNELEYSLNHTQIKALVIADKFKTSDYAEMIYELAPELYENDDAFFESKALP
ncbi:MAG: AMP-binding protein, partial [Gillisia sp.]|nr:AMP-binding protein [Gillisia sp.]